MNGDVTLKIGVSTNDTQCVSLQVQDKVIKATKVYLQLVKTYVRPFFSFSGSTSLYVRMSPRYTGGYPHRSAQATQCFQWSIKGPEKGLCLRTDHYVETAIPHLAYILPTKHAFYFVPVLLHSNAFTWIKIQKIQKAIQWSLCPSIYTSWLMVLSGNNQWIRPFC